MGEKRQKEDKEKEENMQGRRGRVGRLKVKVLKRGEGREERNSCPRKRNPEEDRRRMRDVEEEKEEEKGVGNKTKRLFGFSRILRFDVFVPLALIVVT